MRQELKCQERSGINMRNWKYLLTVQARGPLLINSPLPIKIWVIVLKIGQVMFSIA